MFAPPPGMTPPPAPPGGTGPASVPGGMAGSHQQAMTGVKVGLEALQKALPALEPGSELHAAVLKAVTEISKKMAEGATDQAAQLQQLVAMARQATQNPGAGAMQRMFPPPAAPSPALAA